MTALTKTFAALATVAALTAFDAPSADAANHFDVVTVSNPTNVPLKYSFTWGNGEREIYTLQPGDCRWHGWEYDVPNRSNSPLPIIKFDADLTSGTDIKVVFPLLSPAAYPSCGTGKKYDFVKIGSRVLLIRG